jgi:hypothetical protein
VPELNTSSFDSLLEEQIAGVLRGYGVTTEPAAPDSGADMIATVQTADGIRRLTVEVKSALQPSAPGRRSAEVSGHTYVSPTLAANYRRHDMFYVDSHGNAFIALPGFRVDVQGRRPPKEAGVSARPGRAFGVAGTKLVFAFLTKPETVSWAVRDLAALARISTGSVSNTLQALTADAFLKTAAGGRRLRRVDQLAHRWLSSYATRLAPRLEEQSFGGPDPRWWLSTERPAQVVLGGGIALAEMGFDILPATAVIYGPPPWKDIRRAARLDRDGEPRVTLREQFWDPRLARIPQLAPPLLVYADAVASDDPRQLEAAAALWEKNDDLRRLRTLG